MHRAVGLLILCVLVSSCAVGLAKAGEVQPCSKSRLIILADMGNEPDEEQQMAHMLVCSNEFDVEGLIAVTGKYLRTNPRPHLFLKLIDGYAKVVDNLRLHAEGWPKHPFNPANAIEFVRMQAQDVAQQNSLRSTDLANQLGPVRRSCHRLVIAETQPWLARKP